MSPRRSARRKSTPFSLPSQSFPTVILAVSGGADSMAMLYLAARWAKRQPEEGGKLVVATVDHGLRSESRREAQWVGEQARAMGLAHEILAWEGSKPSTGVQDAAREARYRLLSELAQRYRPSGSVAVVTAHTEDDQAETFLMRLARGSGLDGLAAMSASPPARSRCRLPARAAVARRSRVRVSGPR